MRRPSATYTFQKIGFLDEILQFSRVVDHIYFKDMFGQSLADASLIGLHPYHAPFLSLHRASLHEFLYQKIMPQQVYMGLTLTRLAKDPASKKIHVEFSDTQKHSYDLVIGADGIHSLTRKLLGSNVRTVPYPILNWRVIIDDLPEIKQPQYFFGG